MKSLVLIVICAALGLSATAHASDTLDYPTRPVRIVVPFAPGGAADAVSRKIADKLSPALKQPVIVENRAGGNTMIASEYVAKAPKDGYTIYSTNTTIVQVPMLYPNARYDEEKDFTALAQCCSAPLALVVRADSPVKTVKDFIDYYKARPGKTSYGTAGAGGTQHILSEALKSAVGIDSIHVPYKGEAPLLSDFLGGRIDWYIATPVTIAPHIQSGKVRALAVTGADRIALFPDSPTFREAGVSKLDIVGWYGLFVPSQTPAAVIDKLSREVVAILKQPEMIDYLKTNGLVPTALGAGEFAASLPPFRTTFKTMITENNIKVE